MLSFLFALNLTSLPFFPPFFLASVQGPWERAISPNKVPYYIK